MKKKIKIETHFQFNGIQFIFQLAQVSFGFVKFL